MTKKFYIGWVRNKDGKGIVESRPRKQIANAVTTLPPGAFPDPNDGLGNITPYVIYEFE